MRAQLHASGTVRGWPLARRFLSLAHWGPVIVLERRFPPCLWGDVPDGYSLHVGDGSPLWLRVGSNIELLRPRLREAWISRGYWYLVPDEGIPDEERPEEPEGWTLQGEDYMYQVVRTGWVSIDPAAGSLRSAPLMTSLRRPRSSAEFGHVRIAEGTSGDEMPLRIRWSWWRPVGWIVEIAGVPSLEAVREPEIRGGESG